MKIVLSLIVLLSFSTSLSFAQKYYTPKTGSVERKELIDDIRPEFEKYFGVPVKLVVSDLRVLYTATGMYSWLVFEPSHPKENRIYKVEETKLKDQTEYFDSGLRTYTILKKDNKKWSVVTYVCSPTDVPWGCWWKQYSFPRELFDHTDDTCSNSN